VAGVGAGRVPGRGGDALPSVEYPSFDEQPMVEAVSDVRRSIYPGELIDDWLESTAGASS
jgi:hypothetical protein